jgi:hypothetical protein
MRKVNGQRTTDNRRRTPSDGKSSHCLWQGELKTMLFTFQPFQSEFNMWRVVRDNVKASYYSNTTKGTQSQVLQEPTYQS